MGLEHFPLWSTVTWATLQTSLHRRTLRFSMFLSLRNLHRYRCSPHRRPPDLERRTKKWPLLAQTAREIMHLVIVVSRGCQPGVNSIEGDPANVVFKEVSRTHVSMERAENEDRKGCVFILDLYRLDWIICVNVVWLTDPEGETHITRVEFYISVSHK